MDILFFTEDQKGISFKSKRFEGEDGNVWEFIQTPSGWILPEKALLDKTLNLKAKDLTKRQFKETDKIISNVI